MQKKFRAICVLLLLMFASVVEATGSLVAPEGYSLEEMVILSRHNIRAPLSGKDSELGKITPHAWYAWTSNPGELSLRGGVLETIMGQYFRKYLEAENFIPENYIPKQGEVRFFTCSMQRTIATAQYFSSGMLPVANVRIEHRFAPSKMDPIFTPQLTFISNAYRAQAMKEVVTMGGKEGLQGIGKNLNRPFRLMEKVLDVKDSVAAKNGFTGFKDDDLEVVLQKDAEPTMKGSLQLANITSDALTLQYYEEENEQKAGFGRTLSPKEWAEISSIKDVYGDVLFTAPLIAVNAAHPLLQVMHDELENPVRKFTFLCGHDSNLSSVLAALEVEDYSLPNTIETKTPIGAKFVIEKWQGKDGDDYASLHMVYQSTKQLRTREQLDVQHPPMIYTLHLKGLQTNTDGLYKYHDVEQRFVQAIKAYDNLPQDKREEEKQTA